MSEFVAKPSRESMRRNAKLEKVRALRGGVEEMRAASTKYLPKEEDESEKDYKDRLARSWLLPALSVAIKRMADRVFAQEVELGDDVPAPLNTWSENITSEGRNLNVFARDVFEDGVEAGVSFILVDGPRRPDNLTLREEQEGNYRPYMVHVRAENVLGWKTETLGNRTVLKQFRILEEAYEPDETNEFEDKLVEQVRVFDREENGTVLVRVYRNRDGWTEINRMVLDMMDIPVSAFYANRSAFFRGTPTFEHLADLNIAHWQTASDYRGVLHFSSVPIMAMYGFDADTVKIAPNAAIATSKGPSEARIEIVEHSGAAIESQRVALKDLEERMIELGYDPMVPRPGNPTATGKAIDQDKVDTPLRMMAFALKDALEMALGFMAEFAGRAASEAGSVNVNTDHGLSILNGADLDFLLKAVNTGRISLETFHKECVRRGVLMDGLDTDEERDRIADEMPEPVSLPNTGLDDDEEDEEV